MSSTAMSYYAILRYYSLAVKSASRKTVSSDRVECVGDPSKNRIGSSRFVGNLETFVGLRIICSCPAVSCGVLLEFPLKRRANY
jgi:hypothetical protein